MKIVERIVVTDPLGIHGRPAAALAVAVGISGARVVLHFSDKHADAKSVIQMLALGAALNSSLVAEIEGNEDAVAAALAALRRYLQPQAAEGA